MFSLPRTPFLVFCAGLLICAFVSAPSQVAFFQVPTLARQSAALAPATPTLVRPEAIHGWQPSRPLALPVADAAAEDSRFGWDALAVLAAAAVSISAAGLRNRATPAGASRLALLATQGEMNTMRADKARKKQKTPKQKVKAPAAPVLEPEQTFFEGPPSMTETLIPGLSVFTVVGIIPFSASLARQAWTRYKITSRRIEVASGFQGKDVVQVLYREIEDVRWLRRWGGSCGDLVISLKDGSKLEVRSVPEFDKNLAYVMSKLDPEVVRITGYPDKPARDYMTENPEGPKPVLESDAAVESA